jgi:hypothetical protein
MTGGFDEMKDELRRAINRLPENCCFNVIFASEDRPPLPFSELGPVRATREMQDACADFLAAVSHEHNDTWVDEALRLALKQRPDAIWLITDGEYFTVEKSIEDIKSLRRKATSARPLPPIHIIEFTQDTAEWKDDSEQLKVLAKLSGGTFRHAFQTWPRPGDRLQIGTWPPPPLE